MVFSLSLSLFLFEGGAIVVGQESIVYHDGSNYVAVAPPIIKVFKGTQINLFL